MPTMREANAKSASVQWFRFEPMPSDPCIATRNRYCSGVLRPFWLGTSVTQAIITLGAYA